MGAGSMRSYPYGVKWRKPKDGRNATKPFYPRKFKHNTSRALVLVRDPVDTWVSSLGRFWNAKEPDTLTIERDALIGGMKRIKAQIKVLPCESTLYMSYEMLLHFTDDMRAVMASFFGVELADEKFVKWIHNIRDKSRNSSNTAGVVAAAGISAAVAAEEVTRSNYTSTGNSIGPFRPHCKKRFEKKLVTYKDWPSDLSLNCTGAAEGEYCETSLREHLKRWLHTPSLCHSIP